MYEVEARRGGRMRIGEWHPTLRERDAGRWEVRWWRDGRYVRRLAPSKADAEALADAEVRRRRGAADPVGDVAGSLPPEKRHALLLAAARLEAAGGRMEDLPEAVSEWISAHLAAGRITLSAAVREHLEDLAALGRAPSTLYNRRWRLGKLLAAAGDRPMAQLTRGTIAAWVAASTPGSRRDMHAAASALCHWAWERGYLRRNPMENLRKPPAPVPPPPPILPPEAVAAILRAAQEHAPGMVLYFAVGFFAGLRPVRELAGLVWEDIDLADRRIYVPAGRAKTGRCRPVPISGNLAKWLETVPCGLRRGLVAPYSRPAFRCVVAAAGIAWRADVMRHTRVSYRLALTGDAAAVAAEGGHSIDVMHRHYANLRIPAAAVRAFWSLVPDRVRGGGEGKNGRKHVVFL